MLDKPKFISLAAYVVDAELKMPWIDRLRLLCGGRLFITTVVESTRRTTLNTKSRYSVERIFTRMKKSDDKDTTETTLERKNGEEFAPAQ